MDKASTRRLCLWGLGILPVLAGCATTSQRAEGALTPPQAGDDGIVIAESQMVPGTTHASSITGNTDDCQGPGLGITVQGSVSGNKYLYDSNGEPCEPAELLFDGRTPIGQRQADPGIMLTFHDALGVKTALPAKKEVIRGHQPEKLQAIPKIRVTSELLEAQKIEPAAGASLAALYAGGVGAPAAAVAKTAPVVAAVPSAEIPVARVAPQPARPDPLLATLSNWQAQDSLTSRRTQEADAAAQRNLEKIAKDTQQAREQESIAQLSAKLRERERQIEEEQRRHAETLARAQETRAQTVAARQEWQQHEDELSNELESNRQRLQQFEQLAGRLQAEKSQKEEAYQQKISTLSADLQAAQVQADGSRRNLILQAAAKIAEAEQLAHAAQVQEQDIKLREAARLKAEAETMMDRALAIKTGQQVVVDGAPVVRSLSQTPVVVHAKNQSLEDLVAAMLKQAEPQAGVWKADWQLSPKGQAVLKEKWSLTAEAPVQQVLAQITQQVQAKHGVVLGFTQFSQSRLLVVTDVPTVGSAKP